MPYTIADFTAAMPDVVRDDTKRLSALDRYAVQAIVDRYSRDAPLEIVSDVPGTGSKYIPLPQAPEGQSGVFEPGFSIIKQIEYPIGQQPPQLVLDSDFRLYRTPQAQQIVLSFDTPSADEVMRLTWTARHAEDGSTVPGHDFYAVVDYASSLALEALAAVYVQVGDPSIGADVTNYRTKSQEYLTLAKAIRKRYYLHMGVEEDTAQNADGASLAIGNMHLQQNSGVDRLVHGKYTR